MQCVTQWEPTTQVAINDAQFGNRPFCRDFEYYVNPDSDSIIELGTVNHPYKQITYAMIEILNYHSHTVRNLTIYLMEYTRNELAIGTGKIINITNIDIKPYTLRSVNADKATIVGIDEANIATSQNTFFSIMKSYEQRFDDMVTNNVDIPEREKAKTILQTYLIIWYRSSISLQNLELTSEHESIQPDITFLYPVYLQYNSASFKDLHIRISGSVTRAYDPFFLYIENVDMDLYRNLAGFDMRINWNYPEAALNTSLYSKNTTFYFSQKRAISLTTGSEIVSTLPGDFVFEDHQSHSYIYPYDRYGMVAMIASAEWSPDTETDRFFNVTNVNYTSPIESPVSNLLYMNIVADVPRITHSYFQNITCLDHYLNIYSWLYLIGNPVSYLTVTGLTITNTNSLLGINTYEHFAKLEINNMYLERANALELYTINVYVTQEIVLRNIMINNNDVSNPDSTGIFFLSPLKNGITEVSNFNVMNSDIGAKHAIEYRQTESGIITFENVYAENVTLGTDARVIRAQSLTSFYLKNSTFIQIRPRDLGDSTPKLVELSLVLTNQLDYFIQDTYIEDSQVGYIELSGVKSSKLLSSSFVLSNFTLINSDLEFSHDLISFTGVETSNDFQITLKDISMSNITFYRTGNLMNFEHQTNTILILDNAIFENIVGAQILIRSSNLQNSDLKTKISMTNITAVSISGNSKSLIYIEEGGELYIYNSSFTNIDNTERGAVLNAGYKNCHIEIHNSTFENNLSIYGGVANVQDGSVIKFFDSNITNNFAIQSGAIQASSDGRFELYKWNMVKNYAYTLSVSEVFITS